MERKYPNTNYAPTLSESNTGYKMTTYADNAVVAGTEFSMRTAFTIANEAVFSLVIDPRALVANGKRFTLYPPTWGVDQGYVEVITGVCTAYDSGGGVTSITPNNGNYFYRTLNPALTVVNYGVARSLTGLVLADNIMPVGTRLTNQSAGGGVRSTGKIIIADPSLIYVYQCTNDTGESIRLSMFQEFFETNIDSDLGF